MHHRTLQACRIPTTRGLSIKRGQRRQTIRATPGHHWPTQKATGCKARNCTADGGAGPGSRGGHLLCCDVSVKWTSIARAAWESAGVADRIELRVGPGLETLRSLPPGEQFDFAFIDAGKTGYAQYHEQVLARLRPGGLMLLDNLLQGGHVVDDLADDEDVAAIRALNEVIAADPRVEVV